jgi:hypothetical protein
VLVLRGAAGRSIDGFVMLDSATGKVLARTPVGVPDAAWSVVYVVRPSARGTSLEAIDLRTGATLRQTTINGRYTLASVVPGDLPTGLTPDGRTLLLVGAEPAPGRSQFVVLDTMFAAPPQAVDLAGDFEFDAIGPDGHLLFLIEHIGERASGHYQVRAFDLVTGSLLEGAIVDKREIDEEMNGRPVARAASAGDRTVYTVYVKEDGTAFVHELGTVDGFALCIDLPEGLRASTPGQAEAWRIVTAGDRAFVVNPRLGAALSVGHGTVIAAGDMPVFAGTGPVDAVLEPRGGRILVGDSNGLTFLRLDTIRVEGSPRAGIGSGGVAVTRAGRAFALDPAVSTVAELTTTGDPAEIRRLELPTLDGAPPATVRLVGIVGG